jgi:hypothetical protein
VEELYPDDFESDDSDGEGTHRLPPLTEALSPPSSSSSVLLILISSRTMEQMLSL